MRGATWAGQRRLVRGGARVDQGGAENIDCDTVSDAYLLMNH
jgi:hypothetical protein